MAQLRADLDASARQVAGLQSAAAASDARCADLAAGLDAMTARLAKAMSEAEASDLLVLNSTFCDVEYSCLHQSLNNCRCTHVGRACEVS